MEMVFDRLSPVSFAQSGLTMKKAILNGMEIVLSYENTDIEMQRMKKLGICDVSAFSRVGIKGAKAVDWLESQRFTVPEAPNTWRKDHAGGLVLRLGRSEFLLEGFHQGQRAINANDAPENLYEVARYDASFILSGVHFHSAFSEICALDLSESAFAADAVLMTSVAGVSVTLIRQLLNGELVYRLWCDGSYGNYMWSTLTEIAGEFGGGAVGLDVHFKQMITSS